MTGGGTGAFNSDQGSMIPAVVGGINRRRLMTSRTGTINGVCGQMMVGTSREGAAIVTVGAGAVNDVINGMGINR
jgi:hypothetical protein